MISICIITRNEQDNLRKCLAGICRYGQEIIVVDTGSTDDSILVAKEYTDRVCQFEWCDDFSAARNYAASQAANDSIMMLDTDEFVERVELQRLLKLVERNERSVGRIHRRNAYESGGQRLNSNELVNRIYDRRYYHYEGRIHEQIVLTDAQDKYGYDCYEAPVYTEHAGYMGDKGERERKAKRNIGLLKQVLEEDGTDPYILYQLGKAYYYMGDYAEAARYFEQMLEVPLNPDLEYVIDMVTTYGYALINSGQTQKALILENVYNDFCGSADFLFMMGLVFMQNARFEDAVHSFLEAVKLPVCSVEGVNSYQAYYNVGVIYECLGDKKQALQYYRRCGKYEPARLGIKRVQ